MQIKNFGHSFSFQPQHYYQPKTEAEVLEILARHKNGQVRVMGGGHAWSRGIISNDAFLDIRFLDQIEVRQTGSEPYANVGGGVKLKRLVETLAKQNFAIPAMGGIMRQSVAGLASTATHGTGRSSFSHYIKEIRLAAYDSAGNPKIYEFRDGEEFLAARTAVGCMGVILSMKIPLIPRYWITESSKSFKTLDEVLAQEGEWPIQQTAVIPHAWNFLVFRRKISPEPGVAAKFRFFLLRGWDYIKTEITPHVLLKLLLMLPNSRNWILKYYKSFMPRLIADSTTINPDYKGLTLHTRHHYTFRHAETEIFIPEPNIRPAFAVIRQITDWFAGTINELDPNLTRQLGQAGLLQEGQAGKGQYVLHYVPFIRKVFPDESLIGTTANNQTYYAIGFFTYHKEEQRQGYYNFTKTLAKVLNLLFDARLHWGKNFPLEHSDIARLYPDLEKFRNICRQVDPNGVFQNDYTKKVLGFK